MNSQIRKILREISIRTNSLSWIQFLQTVCDNKNNSKSSTTKYTPNQLWKSTNTPVRHSDNNSGPYFNRTSIQDKVAMRMKQLAKKKLEKDVPFEVGDLVRVKMTALYSQVRQMVKDKDKKFIVVRYSPDVYRIRSILKKDNVGYENKRYTLEYLNGDPVQTQIKLNNPNATRHMKRFFASDFLRVENIPESPIINSKDALKLNKLRDVELPIQIAPLPPLSKPRVETTTPVVATPVEKEKSSEPRKRKQVERLNLSRAETPTNKRRTMAEWNTLLQGKRFKDDEGEFEILKVIKSQNPNYKNETVAEIINVNDLKKDGQPKKSAMVYDQRLKEILPAISFP
jgi:hypothetical protein